MLLTRGVPAWMKVLRDLSTGAVQATRMPEVRSREGIPEGVANDMVRVMAEIVLAVCVKEAVA